MRLIIATTLLLTGLAAQAATTSAKTEEAVAVQTAEAVTATTEPVLQEPAASTEASTKAEGDLAGKKESEIPLNLDAPKKASEEGHPIFKVILAISMMGLVGTGAYIFMRKYGKANFTAGKNNEIKVLTQHFLGPKKSLAIIRVAGESILIGVTDQNINMIKSLALLDDEVPEEVHSNNFADIFGTTPAATVTTSRTQPADTDNDVEEEFSIRGVKDVVSKKLKGMRSLQ
ncbi:flagellar biosynthetic protein FliO [Bdellovibrio sp. HCB337]|uniref:flagellar biosynthetic protein FliO n=1 Tax=Bdellovibrio sp. HCB337 TaxID=3394358 RepID=UPI0039A52BB4